MRRLGPQAAAVPVLRTILQRGRSWGHFRHTAALALGEIGPAAHAALPELLAALKDRDIACGAAWALKGWGEVALPAVPALIRRLSDSEDYQRSNAAQTLGAFGPAAGAAVSALLPLLSDPDGDVRAEAALAVWRITGQTELAVPPMVRILEGIQTQPEARRAAPTAAAHLALIGPAAREALPALRGVLGYPSQWIQIHAAHALWRIEGDSGAALRVLSRHLRADGSGLVVLECLAELGPQAQSLVPELRRIVESDRRLLELGSHDTWIEEDEAYRAAAARTLARIEAG